MLKEVKKVDKSNDKIEKRIEPNVFIAVTLDDISRKLSKLISEQETSKEISKKILKEHIDERDEGEYIRREGTASTTFTIIDILGTLGHNVKGYSIHNDGNNNIYVAHNVTDNSLDTDIQINVTRFNEVQANEELIFDYNRKKIRNLYLATKSGTSDYRLKMVW